MRLPVAGLLGRLRRSRRRRHVGRRSRRLPVTGQRRRRAVRRSRLPRNRTRVLPAIRGRRRQRRLVASAVRARLLLPDDGIRRQRRRGLRLHPERRSLPRAHRRAFQPFRMRSPREQAEVGRKRVDQFVDLLFARRRVQQMIPRQQNIDELLHASSAGQHRRHRSARLRVRQLCRRHVVRIALHAAAASRATARRAAADDLHWARGCALGDLPEHTGIERDGVSLRICRGPALEIAPRVIRAQCQHKRPRESARRIVLGRLALANELVQQRPHENVVLCVTEVGATSRTALEQRRPRMSRSVRAFHLPCRVDQCHDRRSVRTFAHVRAQQCKRRVMTATPDRELHEPAVLLLRSVRVGVRGRKGSGGWIPVRQQRVAAAPDTRQQPHDRRALGREHEVGVATNNALSQAGSQIGCGRRAAVEQRTVCAAILERRERDFGRRLVLLRRLLRVPGLRIRLLRWRRISGL